MQQSMDTKKPCWYKKGLNLLVLLLLRNKSKNVTDAFVVVPLSHRTRERPTTLTPVFLTRLEDHTVRELWQIVEGADLFERGIKARLKRKQDIIDYIREQEIPVDHQTENQQSSGTEQKIENEDQLLLEHKSEKGKNDDDAMKILHAAVDKDIASKLPSFLLSNMARKGITSLLPIQQKSFQQIYSGEDAVLQSPTGSGKTLAYILPLLARKWKGSIRQKHAAPTILVLAPSRELARQIGNEFSKFSKTSTNSVTVFGGVPIERHIAMLKSKPQILVGTPGRLRELVREGHVDYSQVASLVLDEADSLLDKADSPDVLAIMEDMEEAIEYRDVPEYQLVLVSATINDHVVDFVREMEISPRSLIRIREDENSKVRVTPTGSKQDDNNKKSLTSSDQQKAPTVEHWHMSCKSSVRPSVLVNLLSLLNPQLCIVFVATKRETESVAAYLSTELRAASVRTLHGDMPQSARTRTITLTQQATKDGSPQVLVATDALSRGIDLDCDLVVQFGVPRIAGKEGTFSTELYTHRTGRTGRLRIHNQFTKANAIMLYDPAAGEGKLIPELAKEVHLELGVNIMSKPPPSTLEIVDAGYQRAKELILQGDPTVDEESELEKYIRSKLEIEKLFSTENPKELLRYLATAMAVLSNLDPSMNPYEQHKSLLSFNEKDRTLRLTREDGEELTPSEVTRFCKDNGSGKLGRVIMWNDGSALFDLPLKRAEKLIETWKAAQTAGWQLEMPLTLPAEEQ